MTRTALIVAAATLWPALTHAESLRLSCLFDTECHETDSCTDAAFALDLDEATKEATTEFGDLTIIAIRELDDLTTAFLNGSGATYLLSAGPEAARISAHIEEGPIAITYMGTCEEVE